MSSQASIPRDTQSISFLNFGICCGVSSFRIWSGVSSFEIWWKIKKKLSPNACFDGKAIANALSCTFGLKLFENFDFWRRLGVVMTPLGEREIKA